MGNMVIKYGERVFSVLIIVSCISSIVFGLYLGISTGGVQGLIIGVIQAFSSLVVIFVIALIVYSLLSIQKSLAK